MSTLHESIHSLLERDEGHFEQTNPMTRNHIVRNSPITTSTGSASDPIIPIQQLKKQSGKKDLMSILKEDRPIEIPYYLWDKLKSVASGAAGRGSISSVNDQVSRKEAEEIFAAVNDAQEMQIPPVGYEKVVWEHLKPETKRKIIDTYKDGSYRPPSNVVAFFSRPDATSMNQGYVWLHD